MLRIIIVVILSLIGIIASFHGSFYALLFYIWVAYFRPESWTWITIPLAQNLSMFVGIFLLVSTIVSQVKIRVTFFSVLLLMAAAYSLMTALVSNYSSASLAIWTEFIKIIIITYLITMLINSEKDLKITLIVISLSLGFEGAKQGWAQLILNPGATNNNTHPLLGDNNGVAIGMIMLMPLLFSIYQNTERKLIKYGILFFAVGIAYRALSTYSRGGFLAFITMCVIYWLRSKYKVRTLIIVAVLAAVLLPVFPQDFWDRMNTITVEEGEVRESSSSARLHTWRIGWEMALSNPITGVGHGVYREAYDSFDDSGGIYGRRRSVHSSWFGLLSEWGFPGFMLYIFIYIYSIYCCARIRRYSKNNPELKGLENYSSGIETSLIAAGVGITFLTFQYLEMLWHFFALAVVCSKILKSQYASIIEKPDNVVENIDLFKTKTLKNRGVI